MQNVRRCERAQRTKLYIKNEFPPVHAATTKPPPQKKQTNLILMACRVHATTSAHAARGILRCTFGAIRFRAHVRVRVLQTERTCARRFRTNFMCARVCVRFEHTRFIFMMNSPGTHSTTQIGLWLRQGVRVCGCFFGAPPTNVACDEVVLCAGAARGKFASTRTHREYDICNMLHERNSIILLRTQLLLLQTVLEIIICLQTNKKRGADKLETRRQFA